MQRTPSSQSSSQGNTHALRFVRALALVGALPACTVQQEEVMPPPLVTVSSGGAVVQDGVVQSNNTVVQSNNGEQNVEMRTVVVGQQQVVQPAPVCAVGVVMLRSSAEQCTCVALGTGGAAWQCVAIRRDVCALGQMQPGPRGTCHCVATPSGNNWQCPVMQEHHMVGPLPPPELSFG